MKNYSFIVFVIVLIGLAGCDSRIDRSQLEELKQDLQKTLDHTTNKVTEITPSREDLTGKTAEEFAKLSIWEYKVFEVTKAAGPEELEAALTVQGRERWECFDVQETNEKLRFFCRRRPETYLRYIPRWFPF